MDFRGDERAVTVQIGAVLLFGIIIISMSMYQATVVPNQNEQVEFLHNQEVHDQFESLRGAIIESSSETTPRPSTVSLGTRYPSRTLFVNPGPVSGTLQTRELGSLTVTNVETTEAETSDYVNGGLSYETKSLEYRPDYNVLQSAPTTVYENTVSYNRFDTGYEGTLNDGQSLINGRTISLVLLQGDYSENGVGSATVDAQAVSPATRTVPVTRDASGNVTISVPTELSEDAWRELLAEGNDDYVHSVDRSGDRVEIEMQGEEGGDSVTYDLRVGAVEVGSGVDEPAAYYLTVVDGASPRSIGSGDTETLTFEVRDRYNNPVSGVSVNFSASGGSVSIDPEGPTTDSEGRIRVTVTGESAGTAEVLGSFDDATFTPSTRQDAGVEVSVSSGEAAESGGVGGLLYENDAVARDGDDSFSTPGGVEFSLRNVGSDSVELLSVVVNPHDDSIDGLSDRVDGGDDDPGETELYVESPSGDALVDYQITQNEFVDVPEDGLAIDIDESGDIGGSNPVVGSGESARFYVYEFYDTGGFGGTNVDMTGEWLSVRVTYRLPSGLVDAKTFSFEANAQPEGGVNAPPTPRTTGPYSVPEGESIQLDGSGSSDSDGSITSYSWSITDDPTGQASLSNPSSARPTFNAPDSVSGDTDVTVELTVTDDDGATSRRTTTVTVTDTDGTPSPSVSMRVDDLTDIQTNNPDFVVSYDIGDTNASFERVEVRADSTEGSASGFAQQSTSRGSVRFQPGYGVRQTFEVTIDVIYDGPNGEYVESSRTVTDVADARNRNGNADLSLGSSASIDAFDVEDRTNTRRNEVWYRADYDVSSGDFSRVELVALNLNGNGATTTTQRTDRSRNNVDIIERRDGAQTDYRVGILVYDDTGAVVDIQTVDDVADGNGP
ncbi:MULTISPECIES: Ig-like domain-containing protein [Haloferax]|uniref:Ig-like domain-containing protein n=1 Tax=Haloferax TaxID=2251 RepID=UPI000E26D58F|nr:MULTISPECIES: Ig-like domain-containing protein [Haloferax]MBC9987105.1 PKD domain-containing protein [Haloferax sp. AS1]RDZ34961.1 PKD domain-containing protein [Haloferax sp. Atlit-24N]RLM35372.1 PKD domain-containing protein [Haloferax sp. Atlit-109R]RLM43219.1 PKD domain-containing protein [Haloferax sp. Atlit-105R]WEL30524.1 putative surface protein, possible component of pili like system [Haloferax alexandrinus]